jgi:hypothetical protein
MSDYKMAKVQSRNGLNVFDTGGLCFEQSQVGKNGKNCRRKRREKQIIGPGALFPVQPKIQDKCLQNESTDASGTGIEFEAEISCFTNKPRLNNRICCPPSLNWDQGQKWTS